MIKIKEEPIEVTAEGAGAGAGAGAATKEKVTTVTSPSKVSYFQNKDTPSFGNTAINKQAEEREKEFKDKMEKYIWSCVPDKRIY